MRSWHCYLDQPIAGFEYRYGSESVKRTFPEQEKLGAGLAEIRTAFRSDLAESLT
jgi:hypothetical protein